MLASSSPSMKRLQQLLVAAGQPWSVPLPLSGGDMGDVWRIGQVVAKTHPSPPTGLFMSEAEGLQCLAAHGARTPKVHFADETGIVMDWLEPGLDDPRGLAENLVALHTSKAPHYGTEHRVFLGRFSFGPPATATHWNDFWHQHRIHPLLRACWSTLGPLGPRVENLMKVYKPPTEGPCLLHGDLWNGNVVMARSGATLIDPSVWWGERGVDLAMMRLFGGFSKAFWDAYQARLPISPDVEAAVPYYQLYYLLVHVHFFGAGYCSGIRRVLETYRL